MYIFLFNFVSNMIFNFDNNFFNCNYVISLIVTFFLKTGNVLIITLDDLVK